MYLSEDGKPETKISMLLKDMKKGTRSIMHSQKVTHDCDFIMNILFKWDHKDWKSNAFELEKTRVTDPKRIETLLIPVAFAYVFSVMVGKKKKIMEIYEDLLRAKNA